MSDAIVVVNAGSSSVKFSVFVGVGETAGPRLELRGQFEGLGAAPRLSVRNAADAVVASATWPELAHRAALEHLLDLLRERLDGDRLLGIGHRVVHGGLAYRDAVRVDRRILQDLHALVPLAPLHQPHNLAAVQMLMDAAPGLPQVACFDTAFHAAVPELAQMFGLPHQLHEQGIRRYGFHGLSYEYIAGVLAGYDGRAADGRTVVMHLGAGCSMCALERGRSVATTMGFTAVDGLIMGTRCGNLDPGVVLYLIKERGMSVDAVNTLLYTESGLLGVSGLSSDMRALLASRDERATLAIDLFCYRIRREFGSLVAALGGADAIVFTAGIGENAAAIRQRLLHDAAWCGIEPDLAANLAGGPRLTTDASRVSAWVIPTNEELVIARHTQRALAA